LSTVITTLLRGKTILERIHRKEGGKLWIGFIWLRIVTNGGSLWIQ